MGGMALLAHHAYYTCSPLDVDALDYVQQLCILHPRNVGTYTSCATCSASFCLQHIQGKLSICHHTVSRQWCAPSNVAFHIPTNDPYVCSGRGEVQIPDVA